MKPERTLTIERDHRRERPRREASVHAERPHSAALAASARELNENLAALQSLLRQLLGEAEQKLGAIRTADTEELHRSAARENDLLAQVARVEQRRQVILAPFAQDVPAVAAPRPAPPIGARHLPEPLSSIFTARGVALRQIATELQEKNQLVARVARSLQSHIRAIFADLAKVNQESVVYGPKGQHEQRTVRSWVDAVG